MRTKLLIPALAGSLLILCGCEYEDWGNVRRTQDFHFSHPLKSGSRVSVEGFNGSVEISGWDQETVDISGSKYAPSDELLEALKIDVSSHSDSVTVRAIRPSSHRGNLGAKFIIKVPRQSQLDRVVSSNGGVRIIDVEGPVRVKTSNGSIRAQNLKGELDAQTSNGPVEVQDLNGSARLHTSNGHVHAAEVRGSVEANTSNAGIQVQLAKTEAGRPIRLETSNGSVELTLPPDARNDVRISTNNSGITVHGAAGLNARVLARTSNSRITTDFELKTQGEVSKNRLDGTIGAGGPLLDLTTSNGSIKLLRM
jgi:hypothetical protein